MSADTPIGDFAQTEHDARLIADLREWRSRVEGSEHDRWSARLTLDELDALLRAVDDRDRLAREGCNMPDEHSEWVSVPTPFVHYPVKYRSGSACGIADVLGTTLTLDRHAVTCPACLDLLGPIA